MRAEYVLVAFAESIWPIIVLVQYKKFAVSVKFMGGRQINLQQLIVGDIPFCSDQFQFNSMSISKEILPTA